MKANSKSPKLLLDPWPLAPILCALLVFSSAAAASGQVVISEFMAKNAKTFADENGDFSDWIELRNTSGQAVSLEGWALTDSPTNLTKWKFPNTTLPVNSYLVVFASGKNRAKPGAPFHTSFQLEGKGEFLALVKPDGHTLADSFAAKFPPQAVDVSFGMERRFYPQPTPGRTNGASRAGLVDSVRFSLAHGFYDAEQTVTLTSPTPGVSIRYTVDGSEPTATRGTVYQGPIRVRTTTPLRATAYKEDYIPSPVGTQTYIFLNDVLRQTGAGLPNSWGNDWEMDPRVVNDPAYAGRIRQDMKSLPILCLSVDPQQFWGPQGIYTRTGVHGESAERACSAELFFPNNPTNGFQINCGLRIAGGASRSMTPKHGLRLLFKAQYGASKLEFPFFENSPLQEFDSLALRPNFNMSWVRSSNSGPLNNSNADGAERTHAIYVRDQFTKESFLAMGQVGAHERFVHLYINGVYWGLYNPSERTDASFAAAYWGGETEDYDAIFSDLSSVARPVDGDKSTWNALLAVSSQAPASPATYARVQRWLDVTNLADYMMLNFYCSTVDWPWQNWNALKKRDPTGRFRFVVWDAEYTLETPPWVPADRTSVGTGGNESDSPARLYAMLRQNPEWRMLFADRVQRHFFNNGALTSANASARFLNLCNQIDGAIVAESARWGDVIRKTQPYTRNTDWLPEKSRLLTRFFPTRTAEVLEQFKKAGLYPSVEAPVFSEHGAAFASQLSLEITATAGEILYTVDGSDPRLPGGARSPTAIRYSGPVQLQQTRTIRARVLNRNVWSAQEEAVFTRTPSVGP